MSPWREALARWTLGLALACHGAVHEQDPPPPGTSPPGPSAAKTAASPPGAEATLPERRPHAPPIGPSCRVMTVSGRVERGAAAVRAGDVLNDGRALELAPDSTLHVLHTVSGRGWTVTGPARLVMCEDGGEEIILARGTLRAEPSAGVRPGAEVWVGTPYGSLRYADAGAELEISARELRVRVASGQLWFSGLAESTTERRLTGSATFGAAHRATSALWTARCGRDATLAETRATELLAASVEPLGARAAEHVRARQRAHASCASARAWALAELGAVGRDAPSAPLEGARAGDSELTRYDQMWRRVPAPPRVVRAP